jgi:hypothetical protein
MCRRPEELATSTCYGKGRVVQDDHFHVLREANPWLWSLPGLASVVKAGRQPAPPDNPYRRLEKAASEVITAGLNLYRDLRDAGMEALFFSIYGPPALLGVVPESAPEARSAVRDPRELPLVRDALAAIGTGGYPEAVALIGALIGRGEGRIPLGRLELVERFIRGDEVLSRLPAEAIRRIKAEQAVIAELEPERGLQSLPRLLADPADRRRALAVLDEAAAAVELTPEQWTILARIRGVLDGAAAGHRPDASAGNGRELAAAT